MRPVAEVQLARRSRVTADDLAEQSLLCIGDAHQSEHATDIRTLLATSGVAHDAIRGVSGFGALARLIASGHGVSFFSQVLAGDGTAQIAIIPFAGAVKELISS